MKTIGEVIGLSASFLEERKVVRGRRMAEDLLAHFLKMRRMDLYLQHDRPVEEQELEQMRAGLKRVAKGEPLEYVLGEVPFFGCRFKIDSRVLIPRPETEILADLVSKRAKMRVKGSVLWDICTGSGVLGVSLKRVLPHFEVTVSDVDPHALSLALENSQLNGVSVAGVLGDLATPFKGKTADVVVCNPPYISVKEYLELDPTVRDFEPRGALVGGERGTEFYERLAAELPPLLNSGGQVFLEIGFAQGEMLRKIFTHPLWKAGELIQDWSGKDRFFFLEKQ